MENPDKPDFSKMPIVEITTSEEKWNTYLLDDENVLRVKIVVVKVLKSDQKDEEGNPVYILRHQLMTDVRQPKATGS
jgi:hypothetical protein